MKIDRRIVQAIEEYGAREIKIKKKIYNSLDEKTKDYIERSGVKVNFSNKAEGFKAIF